MVEDNQPLERLVHIAARAREHVLRMSQKGGCFLGASLSCVDIFVSMYADCLNVSPAFLEDNNRDLVLLSKGHAVPALYATLAETGYLDCARLSSHLGKEDSIYWHPNRAIPGVEFHSGSLGHLLSVGIGFALDARLRGSPSRTYVVVGDGELNEGTLWESMLVAHAQKLERLFLVVDRNQLQANVPTEELNPLEPLAAKFEAFGWNVSSVDGHSFVELRRAFTATSIGHPSAIIANTVRGKGLPEHEGRLDKWFVKSAPEEVNRWIAIIREMEANRVAAIGSSRERWT
jgi:transketolase